MIRRRAVAAGIHQLISDQQLSRDRDYSTSAGALEHAREMTAHESALTTLRLHEIAASAGRE